jgi:ABC-type glycerol-3-phosphate transport system substrate-binding protein
MPGGAQPLIIYPGSEKTDAAWAFIKWVIRPDIQAWISNSQGLFPPARRSVIPLVKDPILRTFGSELMNQYVYTTVIHNPIVSTFNKHLDAVLRGDEPIATATAQIQHELTVSLSAALK